MKFARPKGLDAIGTIWALFPALMLMVLPAMGTPATAQTPRAPGGKAGLLVHDRYDPTQGVHLIFAENSAAVPMQVLLTMREGGDFRATTAPPHWAVVPPGAKGQVLLTLEGAMSSGAQGAVISGPRYHVALRLGDPSAAHDPAAVYRFPLAHGARARVTGVAQGGAETRMALPPGAPVHAARAGILAQVGAPTAGQEAFLRVLHDDGTIAHYGNVHPAPDGPTPGTQVKTGALLGLVADGQATDTQDSTGSETGGQTPAGFSLLVGRATHLGQTAPDLAPIPPAFVNRHGAPIKPHAGGWYMGATPGGPPISEKLGRELDPNELAAIREPVPESYRLTLDTTVVDDTHVLHVSNGYPHARVVIFDWKERENLRASRRTPARLIVPPLTRVFLLLANPKNPTQEMRYKVKYSTWQQ